MVNLFQMGAEHYLAIDIGATKTLFAVFTAAGEVVREKKIKTNPDYEQFKQDAGAAISELGDFKFAAACCALPGRIDLANGVGVRFGNLPTWQNIPAVNDLQTMLPGSRVFIHNDAKLAGLSEAKLLGDQYAKVLYLTLSTGIGGAIIIGQKIVPEFVSFEPGSMQFDHEGKTQKWESFASGRALHKSYGKLASEIEDPAIWQAYVKDLVIGFEDLLATVQPDAVIIGGGVGAHFEKFHDYLDGELRAIDNPLVPIPPLLKAQRPEEAVIYGCYDYIKQNIE